MACTKYLLTGDLISDGIHISVKSSSRWTKWLFMNFLAIWNYSRNDLSTSPTYFKSLMRKLSLLMLREIRISMKQTILSILIKKKNRSKLFPDRSKAVSQILDRLTKKERIIWQNPANSCKGDKTTTKVIIRSTSFHSICA